VQRRVGDSAAYLGQVMGQVPVLLIPCVEAPTLPAGNQAGLWGSLLPAVWSYMLAARARGLGTAWTTLHLRYEREVAELLGLPGHVRQGALVPTAYYTGDTLLPRRPPAGRGGAACERLVTPVSRGAEPPGPSVRGSGGRRTVVR
jgi:nitroreductase